MKSLYTLLYLLLINYSFSFGQAIKGKVQNSSGTGISNIRIQYAGGKTFSDMNGEFTIPLQDEKIIIELSGKGYLPKKDTLFINENQSPVIITLIKDVLEIEEVKIIAKSEKQLGHEYMKQVIQKRPEYDEQIKSYQVDIYSITKLDKETQTTTKPGYSELTLERNQQLEWKSKSYYEFPNKYKNYFEGYLDYSDQGSIELHGDPNSNSGPNMFGNESMVPNVVLRNNPYVFIKDIKEADFNIYKNIIDAPSICGKPIVSPLAYNAFLYYTFSLQDRFIDPKGDFIYKIAIKPLFTKEALVSGTLLVREKTWEVLSYDLTINPSALLFFKSMHITGDYALKENKLIPLERKFEYFVYDFGKFINVSSDISYSNYIFSDEVKSFSFWKEPIVFTPECFDKKHEYWKKNRAKQLNDIDLKFIKKSDSIANFKNSTKFLKEKDSAQNQITLLDVLGFGVNFNNSIKKQKFWVSGLFFQVVPLGVGGYRHRLWFNFTKTFKNGQALSLEPVIDYGFLNKDIKGEFAASYTYNPLRFSKLTIRVGDIYDYINSYQSISGTFGPSNRVRNQKLEIEHRFEVFNGLFLKSEFLHSNRIAIGDLKYPNWVNAFGVFSKPQPFDNYTVSIIGIELEYLHNQKYLIKDKQKIIIGSNWPRISLKYTTGIPSLWMGESNYSYLETKISKDGNLNTLGNYNIRLTYGTFLYKKDLRLIEHKYFRASDSWLLSNPTNSLQLLDTNLNTANSFIQLNGIHHFNGFFLDKIWLLNRLKLEEYIGGSVLSLPNTNFIQIEEFIGIEKKIRIKKNIFKLGLAWANSISTHLPIHSRIKLSINLYDSSNKKWAY